MFRAHATAPAPAHVTWGQLKVQLDLLLLQKVEGKRAAALAGCVVDFCIYSISVCERGLSRNFHVAVVLRLLPTAGAHVRNAYLAHLISFGSFELGLSQKIKRGVW